MTIESALNILRPNAKWAVRGDTYAGLEWMDAFQSKPTEEEVAETMLLPEPVVVPQEVPMWAFRLALEKIEMLDPVLAFVQSLPHDAKREAETHLEYGNYIRRDHPLMAAATRLGLDSAKVDDIFRVADELKDGVADFGEVAVGPEDSAERTLWNRVKGWVSGLFGGG